MLLLTQQVCLLVRAPCEGRGEGGLLMMHKRDMVRALRKLLIWRRILTNKCKITVMTTSIETEVDRSIRGR